MDEEIYVPEIIKTKNKDIYIIYFNDSRIDIESLIKEKKIRIFLNNDLIHESVEPNLTYILKINSSEYKIDIKCNKQYQILRNANFKELGILINNIPVKNPYANYYSIVKKGRHALIFFLCILILKIVIGSLSAKEDYLIVLIGSIIYSIPAILLIISITIYKKNLKLAIVMGLIIGCLEFVEFITACIIDLAQVKDFHRMIVWGGVRVYFISLLINSMKNIKKL